MAMACRASLTFAVPSDARYLLLQRSGSYDLKKVTELNESARDGWKGRNDVFLFA